MRRIAPYLLMLLASLAKAEYSLPDGPFQGVDLDVLPLSQRDIIVKATEDFELVRAGRKPHHATIDAGMPVPADGGTHFYQAKGYRLTIVKSLSSFGSADRLLHGYIYGPVLAFDPDLALGSRASISSLRFYTWEQMRKLLDPG